MKRFWITIWLIGGALLLGCALLVPAHFRAVDSEVVARAGQERLGPSTPTLVEEGITLLSMEKLGPARMLLRAAQSEGMARSDWLAAAVARFTRDNPSLVALGGAAPPLDQVEIASGTASEPRSIIDLLTRRVAREKALELVRQSRRPGVQQILRNRTLTNTVHFPAASSASGQALDTAIITAALLYQGEYLTPSFRDLFELLSFRANRGENSGALELVYLDLLSLGRRLDWVSLTELMKRIDDLGTLRDLAQTLRAHGEATANIYSALLLSGNASGLAHYLTRYPETGFNDLAFALRNGRSAVELLLQQQQRVYYGGFRSKVVAYDPFYSFFYGLTPTAVASRGGALSLKYAFLLLATLCIARAVGSITSALGHRFGMRFAADCVLALAMTFVASVAVEPFLGLPNQLNEFPIRFQIPNLAGATGLKLQQLTRPYMNQLSIISLIIFFFIQAAIYIWCLTKLAEIRRQPIGARMKLKLIENEDLLFDAGLYVGFVGSVLSLILMSIGVGKISMMAYASTSFGIIFVSALKIFHVRPMRRKLILESEAQP